MPRLLGHAQLVGRSVTLALWHPFSPVSVPLAHDLSPQSESENLHTARAQRERHLHTTTAAKSGIKPGMHPEPV